LVHATLVANAMARATLALLSTGTLIAVTIALAILALFVTAITIRRTLLSFVIAHRRVHVVALLTPSCQPPPAFVAPVAG
jgi:hypothetical protein